MANSTSASQNPTVNETYTDLRSTERGIRIALNETFELGLVPMPSTNNMAQGDTNLSRGEGQDEIPHAASERAEDTRMKSAMDDPKPANEQSPLLSPSESEEEEEGLMSGNNILNDDPDTFSETKGMWYMILLTLSIGGLQVAWGVELSNGTPYLLSLGLSKSLMALVWIAGPMSGALVQPYIGILSDRCRSPWGKRRPFMAIGTAATVLSLVFLSWVREIVGGFLSIFGADKESQGVKVSIIVVAVILVYILDFAIATGLCSYTNTRCPTNFS